MTNGPLWILLQRRQNNRQKVFENRTISIIIIKMQFISKIRYVLLAPWLLLLLRGQNITNVFKSMVNKESLDFLGGNEN
jgi:hypothetical protein